jgi:hypothetical protein
VSTFVDRMVGRTSKQEDKGMAKESDRKSPAEDVSAIARVSDYTVHSDSPETWAGQDEPSEVTADYGKLGEHVTSVLEAANQAAATIRDDARATAQEIAERAQPKPMRGSRKRVRRRSSCHTRRAAFGSRPRRKAES